MVKKTSENQSVKNYKKTGIIAAIVIAFVIIAVALFRGNGD